MSKFAKFDLKFLANKANMYTMAALLTKPMVMDVLDVDEQMWTTSDGKTLVEKCRQIGDQRMFDICLEKIVNSQRNKSMYFNQETLGLIINSQE